MTRIQSCAKLHVYSDDRISQISLVKCASHFLTCVYRTAIDGTHLSSLLNLKLTSAAVLCMSVARERSVVWRSGVDFADHERRARGVARRLHSPSSFHFTLITRGSHTEFYLHSILTTSALASRFSERALALPFRQARSAAISTFCSSNPLTCNKRNVRVTAVVALISTYFPKN